MSFTSDSSQPLPAQASVEGLGHGPKPPVTCLIGILPGEGASPEAVASATRVLQCWADRNGERLNFRQGGIIGDQAQLNCGESLPPDVQQFCTDIFSGGGAILAGAGGSRFVYDTRQRFQLFCKVNPIRSFVELGDVRRIVLPREIDLVVYRENLDGLYHGEDQQSDGETGREVSRTIRATESNTRNLLRAAARAARERNSHLTMACKRAALEPFDALWREIAAKEAEAVGIELQCVDIDLMSYRLVQEPECFDVIAAPNCFGDILADLGGALCGGRGTTYGGSFSASGRAVFQTNHGAAHDLKGLDQINPVGQILAAAMMLRDHFGVANAFDQIERAVRFTWADGIRTADVCPANAKPVGTVQFTDEVIGRLETMRE